MVRTRYILSLAVGVILCLSARVEANRPTVTQVVFEGVRAISTDALRNDLVMRPAMPVDSALVVGDMQRILAHYQALGYWRARVHFPEIQVKDKKAIIRFRIEEMGRTRIDAMEMRGKTVFSQEVLSSTFSDAVGAVLTSARLDRELKRLLAFYENRGYPFCSLDPEVEFSQNKARIAVMVDPGPLCVVDTVVFEGNAVTRSDVLLREMRLVLGAVYDQRRVDRAERFLKRLPFLISVDHLEVIREDNFTSLVVRVREARTARVEGGMGYGPQGAGARLTGALGLNIHNVAGAGRLGQLSWKRAGVGASDLKVLLQEPWVLNKPFSAEIELAAVERSGYSEWVLGMGATLRAWEEGSLRGKVSRGHVVPDSLGIGIYEESDRWALSMSAILDYRDGVWNPRRGWVGEAAFELGRVEGTRAAVIRRMQSVSVQAFYQVGERYVWGILGRGMWVSQSGGLPREARIRLGGANSIRGYREEAFWTTKAGWISLEWRYLVGEHSRLFAFLDAGLLEDLSGGVAPVGYGAGMALHSKMGMLGLDMAWARADGFGDGKVHVRVVNAF